MEGGFRAWRGLGASGAEDAGMVYFPDDASHDVLLALLWSMEEGARRFYCAVAEALKGQTAAGIFYELARAEEHHRETLEKLSGDAEGIEGRLGKIGQTPGEVMEGGGLLQTALDRIERAETLELLEIAMAFETNAYDLYLKMERRTGETDVAEIFRRLAVEEKAHLVRLGRVLEAAL